jgi:hypothetical protein
MKLKMDVMFTDGSMLSTKSMPIDSYYIDQDSGMLVATQTFEKQDGKAGKLTLKTMTRMIPLRNIRMVTVC